MYKKLLVIVGLLFCCQLALADTCPTINDIKNDHLKGWTAYDSDDGKPLSTARNAEFKQAIEQFALAEWREGKDKNTIHCYYRDKQGSDLEAYLAIDNVTPLKKKNYWYQVSGFTQCAAGNEKCEFEHPLLAENH